MPATIFEHAARRSAPGGRRLRSAIAFLAALLLVAACVQTPPPGEEVTLTVSVHGLGTGAVTSIPIGIDTEDGADSASFARGTTVALKAEPDEGSLLVGFAVAGPETHCAAGGDGSTCVVTLTASAQISVTFDVSGSTTGHRFDLVAAEPVAAGVVSFTLPPDAVVLSIDPLQPGLVLANATVDGITRLAWVGPAATAGAQARIVFDRSVEAPPLDEAAAVSAPDGPPIGALSWAPADASATWPTAPLDGFDGYAASGPLETSFAAYPLGDLNADGSLDARDALLLRQRLASGAWSDFARYHGDVDGDDGIDGVDLQALLDRIVDPSTPATLVVKPLELPFTSLDGAGSGPGVVLIANAGGEDFASLDWLAPAGTSAVQRDGLAGRSAALEVSIPPEDRRGWKPGFLRIDDGNGDRVDVRLGHLVVLVAGQSNASGFGDPVSGWPEAPNASVRMLGNDYVWKNATEPLDSVDGQLDDVSEDPDARYSFGSRLGHLVAEATGFSTYLVPAAKGGSRVTTASTEPGSWRAAADRLDRDTLFGSAVFRARVSAGLSPNPVASQPHPSEGGPVTALVWYQGESDATSAIRRAGFVTGTNAVMNDMAFELGAPTVYVQLASHHAEINNRQQHAIAELQRQLETGFGQTPRPGFRMVASYDLPRSDRIHLSAFGQRLLAERIDLAIRQHVLGQPVDGTGPRLVSVTWSGTSVRIETTHELAAGAYAASYFTVFDGAPTGSLDDNDGTYGTNTITITAVQRDPGNPQAVLLTLASTPSQTPHVRYMAPPGLGPAGGSPSDPALWEDVALNVVRAAAPSGPSGIGLPLPTFGPLPASP